MQIRNYLILFTLGLSIFMSTSAHDKNQYVDIFTEKQKQVIDTKLEIFFNKLDTYASAKQETIYIKLNSRIAQLSGKYATDSSQYAILTILGDIVNHKLDQEIILSTQQILDHVIFGKQYIHYDQADTEDTSGEDSINEDTNTQESITRPDLFTQELNEYQKDILAGTSAGVISLGIRASLEPIDTETVEFTFSQNVDNIGLGGNLYHNGVLVGTASSSDVDGNILRFDNITDLIVPEKTSYLQLELITEVIGKDRIGTFKNDLEITRVALRDNKGVITGDKVGDKRYSVDLSKPFSIVPVKLTVSVESEFENNISTAYVKITPDDGNNNDNGDNFDAQLTSIDIQISGFNQAGDISIFNGNGALIGSTNINSSGDITIPVIPDTISSRGEIYRIITTAEAVFYIPQDGIEYSAGGYNLETNLGKQIFLGQR